MCVKERFVIEIYLFIYAFLSFNLCALFTPFFFQRNTPIVLVDLFLSGGENTNAKIIHCPTRCEITADILASTILCDL